MTGHTRRERIRVETVVGGDDLWLHVDSEVLATTELGEGTLRVWIREPTGEVHSE